MKAAIRNKYGNPDAIEITQVKKPVVRDDEVLVRVYATTVNRTDDGFLRGKPYFARVLMGFPRPRHKILGCEYAGKIDKTGKNVTRFKRGDRVFGYDDEHFGGHAEYKAVAEDFMIEKIPAGMKYEDVAPATEGAHYMLFYLEAAKIKKGKKVLVYGASGAIGSSAVQIMSHLGVDVVAVCGTENMKFIKGLGARKVIDYKSQDYTKIDEKFDVVFDAVGKTTFKAAKQVLTKNGIYMSSELGKFGQNPFFALLSPFKKSQKVLFPVPRNRPKDIALLARLMKKEAYRPLVDRTYQLDEIKDAYKYVETGQKVGNVVVKIK